jgi:hypothetical protein
MLKRLYFGIKPTGTFLIKGLDQFSFNEIDFSDSAGINGIVNLGFSIIELGSSPLEIVSFEGLDNLASGIIKIEVSLLKLAAGVLQLPLRLTLRLPADMH